MRMKASTATNVDLATATCTYCSAPPTKALKTPKGGVVTVCDRHVATAKARISNTSGPINKNVNRVNDLSEGYAKYRTHKCSYCDDRATKGVLWAEHRAIHLSCDKHLANAKARIDKNPGGVEKIVDLSNKEVAGLIDLAMTKDGRKSFKNQGKWRHGFIPVDKAAKRSKAKGSPIAMKRMERLYGSMKLQSSERGATERLTTGRVATARRPFLADPNKKKPPIAAGRYDKEASRGGSASARAVQNWNRIPERHKTIRNGVRYVLSVYKGKPQLVRWTGPVSDTETSDATRRKMVSIRESDARQLSTAQIRRLLKVEGQSDAVKNVLNKVLKDKSASAKPSVKRF